MIFKTMRKIAPAYLQQLFTSRLAEYNLRIVEGNGALSTTRINYLKKSLSRSGVLLWNNLLAEQFQREIN